MSVRQDEMTPQNKKKDEQKLTIFVSSGHFLSHLALIPLLGTVLAPQESAVDNDGYSHKGALQTPNSQHELFSGLTLNKAAEVSQSPTA